MSFTGHSYTNQTQNVYTFSAMESADISLALSLVILCILAGWLNEEQLSIFIKESLSGLGCSSRGSQINMPCID